MLTAMVPSGLPLVVTAAVSAGAAAGIYLLNVRGRAVWGILAAAAAGLACLAAALHAAAAESTVPAGVRFLATLALTVMPVAVMPLLGAWSARLEGLPALDTQDNGHRTSLDQHLLARVAALEAQSAQSQARHRALAQYLGLIVIQAGALEVNGANISKTQAGTMIGDLGRRAMLEVRSLVNVQYILEGSCPNTADDIVTEAWEKDVEDLVARARLAGAVVSWASTGRLTCAGATANNVAYRVIQEGLSHAQCSCAKPSIELDVTATPDTVTVCLRSSAPANEPQTRAPRPGQGLTGLQARLAAMGGELTVTANARDALQLNATIPTTRPIPKGAPSPAARSVDGS
ncbi:hypothetical protein ABZ471_45685 [Streptomyces sp. NPDC005728]|uniref:sensor histidine kinase n=1 Tax=Streptomyces sp. NPDC005728 TaxID=3157054 RepID=UPI00340121E0